MKKLLNLASAILCVLGPGCTPYRLYDGEARPKDQVAVIKMPGGFFSAKVSIDNVDGRSQGTWQGDIEVLPGTHKVVVRMQQGNDLAVGSVSFAAQAGHVYRVETDKTFRVWIVDAETGADVTIPLYQER